MLFQCTRNRTRPRLGPRSLPRSAVFPFSRNGVNRESSKVSRNGSAQPALDGLSGKASTGVGRPGTGSRASVGSATPLGISARVTRTGSASRIGRRWLALVPETTRSLLAAIERRPVNASGTTGVRHDISSISPSPVARYCDQGAAPSAANNVESTPIIRITRSRSALSGSARSVTGSATGRDRRDRPWVWALTFRRITP